MAAGDANGYVAPYRPPADPRYAALLAPPPAPRTRALGIVALVLAIAAFVVAAPGALVAARAAGGAIDRAHADGFDGFAWVMLQPVRTLVLIGEAGLWAGAVLGLWAIVQGAVAIRTGRGRGPGLAAVLVAAAAPVLIALGAALLLLA